MRGQVMNAGAVLALALAPALAGAGGCGAETPDDPGAVALAHKASPLMLGDGQVQRLDEFVRVDGGLYWRWSGTFEHDYVYVGNRGVPLVSDPAVVAWGAGNMNLFVINQNGAIEHGGMAGGGDFTWWDTWDSPAPGRSLQGISVVSGRYGLLDLFVTDVAPYVGTNNLYHRRWDNGADTGWQLMTGSGTNGAPRNFGAPGAIVGGSNGEESFDVFVRGFNTATSRWNIYHTSSSNGGFTVLPWNNLGEPGGAALSSAPSGASWGNGRMDVVVTDTAGTIRHIYTGLCSAPTFTSCQGYQWFWNNWPAPPVASAPSIVATGPNKLQVLARQVSDNGLIQCTWDNQDLGCRNLFGVFQGGPGATSQGAPYCDGQRICFVPQIQKIYDTTGVYDLSAQDIGRITYQMNNNMRRSIVNTALDQVLVWGDGTSGFCGYDARDVYGAASFLYGAEWCTEFARTVLHWAGAADIGDLWDATDVDDMQSVFQPYNWWIERNTFNANSLWNGAEAGDYMTVIGNSGNHFGHSALIVGVSENNKLLFTVEGNVDDCVRFRSRPYIENGQLAGNIDAFGKADLF